MNQTWMGHSSNGCRRPLLAITNDHWLAGASKLTGNQNGGPISAETGQSAAIKQNEKHDKTRVVIPADAYSGTIEHPEPTPNATFSLLICCRLTRIKKGEYRLIVTQ